MPSNLLDLVCSTAWVIRPEALEAIIALADRDDVGHHAVAAAFHFDPSKQMEASRAYETQIPMRAVGTRDATLVDGTHGLYRRGSTAILPVTGAITRYANFFQTMSGTGAVVESLAKDFQRALDDPAITSIILSIDSPGGEVNGIAEFADQIFAGRDSKPVWAYVSDLGASAAYWLASSAERIVVAQTGALGSIGAVAAFRNPNGEKNPPLEFVSSKSPNKRPDLSTEKGRQQIQTLVDTYGDIFIEGVARNRGVDTQTVVDHFGAGGLLIGRNAVEAGMAEDVGSFEGTLAALAEQTMPVAPARPLRRAADMSLGDRIRALLDNPEVADEAIPVEATVPTPTPSPQPAAASDETIRLRADLAARDEENARLRMEGFKIAGSAWFAQVVGEMRAFPAEEASLVAQYVQASLDDHRYGMGIEGMSRVALLKQTVATRTSVKHLTAEALAPTTLAAIMNQSKPAQDPSAPMSAERKAELHGFSVIGQGLLPKQNGTAKSN
jgi:ClpP class serine protease